MAPPFSKVCKELAPQLAELKFDSNNQLEIISQSARANLDDNSIVSRMSNKTYRTQDVVRREFIYTFHDCLWELLAACHYHRDLMAGTGRMSEPFWVAVTPGTSWARGLPLSVTRSLALQIVQAAWFEFSHRHRTRTTNIEPSCGLAIMALRVVRDIAQYEEGTELEIGAYFGEFRGPSHLEDGRPCLTSRVQPITIPVFPLSTLKLSTVKRITHYQVVHGKDTAVYARTSTHALTEEDPDWIGSIQLTQSGPGNQDFAPRLQYL